MKVFPSRLGCSASMLLPVVCLIILLRTLTR
nr:MAG TPA: hypothetical protein [Caudoviricetes sp.]